MIHPARNGQITPEMGDNMTTEQSNEQETTETETAPDTTETDVAKLQADVEKWKALSRKNEAQAKANAEAAQRLADIENESKTETQRLQDQIEAVQAELAASKVAAARYSVASKFGISQDDADMFLTASDETDLTAQAERLSAALAANAPRGPQVSTEGTTTAPQGGTGDGLTAAIAAAAGAKS